MGDVRGDGKDVEGSGHLLSIRFAIAMETNDNSPWCIAEYVKVFVNYILSSLI